MRDYLTKKITLFLPLVILGGNIRSVAAESNIINFDHNLELNSSTTKIESLKLENKINKNLFLPEFFLTGGLGSEKLQDNSYETEKGPFLFLETKLNLYRGGRDSGVNKKINLELTSTKIELEIKKRELQISSYKILSAINLITKEKKLIEVEIESNKSQQKMAQKKLNAGLTSSIDLIDFDLKNDNLVNELEGFNLRRETLIQEFFSLVGGNLSSSELDTMLIENSEKIVNVTETSYENSPKLMLAKKQIELSTINQDKIKSEYLPTIDFEAKWGHLTPQNNFSNSPKEHQVALNITFPLFTGFTTDYKFKQSVIESTQKSRELHQEELEAKNIQSLEMKKIELSKKVLIFLAHSLSQSIKYKELTIGEYKRGIKNSLDIVSASDKKLEIEKKILEAKNDLAISQFTLNETFKLYSGE
jgi:outer membrane protein